MDRIRRVLTAIAHREPDRVPKGELNIQSGLAGRLAPQGRDEFDRQRLARERLNMDLVAVDIDWPAPPPPEITSDGNRIVTDGWGTKLASSGRSHHVIRPAVATPEEARVYRAPGPEGFGAARAARWAKDTDFFLMGITGGCYDSTATVCGFENAMLWSVEEPEALRALAQEIARFHIWAAELLLDAGAHGIVVADDLAYNSGTFLSPSVMREIFFPHIHDIVTAVKARADVPVFLHSDGNLNAILEDIVGMDFDGLQALQPSAGMDIAAIKREWGDRLCLWGNIDQDHLLPFGPPEKIARVVEDTIRACAPGGGFILSSTNTLTDQMPVEHVLAMYETADRTSRDLYGVR